MSDEPAFPIETTSTPYAPGMTLRDWFAGQALAAIIAKHIPMGTIGSPDTGRELIVDVRHIQLSIACGAYEYADAMLTARQKDETK